MSKFTLDVKPPSGDRFFEYVVVVMVEKELIEC
jgi:hypothetical protein